MSVVSIGPGPLEGGPIVSPGPAKESGDSFASHLEHACSPSKENHASVPERPSPKTSGETPATDKGITALKPRSPSDKAEESESSPRSGTGKAAHPATETDAPSEGSVDPVEGKADLLEAADPALGLIPANVDLPINAVPTGPSSAEDSEPTSPVEISLVDETDLVPVPTAEIKERFSTSESEPENSKAEKTEVKIEKVPDPIPLVGGEVVLPVDAVAPVEIDVPTEPVGEESTVAPVSPEGSFPSLTQGTDGATPVLEAKDAAPATKPGQEHVLDAKAPDVKKSKSSPERPDDYKKGAESPAGPAGKPEEKSEATLPRRDAPADPRPEGALPDVRIHVDRPLEKEPRRETRVSQESRVSIAVPPPVTVAPALPVVDPASKGEEVNKIGAKHANPVVGGDTPVPVAGSTPAPVTPHEPAPVETARSAPPAATISSPVDLAREIHVHLESGRSVVRIDLHPRHLGELRISMEAKGKDVSMQFTVDNDNARTAVVAGLREITGTLSSLGWSVNGLAVNVSSGGMGDGRGESGGPIWDRGPQNAAADPARESSSELKSASSAPQTGRWRVDLVA